MREVLRCKPSYYTTVIEYIKWPDVQKSNLEKCRGFYDFTSVNNNEK